MLPNILYLSIGQANDRFMSLHVNWFLSSQTHSVFTRACKKSNCTTLLYISDEFLEDFPS